MNETVHDRAEILRLARLLRQRPQELAFLLAVDDVELRVLRDQVTDALFGAQAASLRRLGAAAKLLPTPVIAKIGQKVFGPLLCARVAGELDPRKATDVAQRLPETFMADVAVELDPRRAQRIIEALPTDTVVKVAVELAGRDDWITLGQFVGFLPEEKIAACLRSLDDTHILRTAFAVDDVSAVPTVIDLLPGERLLGLLSAASSEGLWPTLLSIVAKLRDDQITELAALFGGLDDAVLTELLQVVADHDLWDRLLPLAAGLPAAAQQVLADTAVRLPAETRTVIAQRAEALGVLDRLGPLADAVDEAAA
ncbi:MAG: magnesium transporter MgtE N-terminal domain-containing protein [Thermocrispum sp.]